MTDGRVVIDLVAAQSPSYRERGIARHSIDFTTAMLARHPELIERVLLHPELPPVGGLDDILASGKAVGVRHWEGDRGVFHVTSAFEPEVPIRAVWSPLASVRRMRLVVTVYDLIPDVFPEMYLVDPGLRTRWRACRELVRVADHVFTLSRSGMTDVVQRLGVPSERVSIIGAGCSDRFRRPGSRRDALASARASISGLGSQFIVCNGAIDPRKNVDRLLQAYASLPAHLRERWQLVLVCRIKPLERNHYEVQARRLGIEGQLVLSGYVDDRILVSLYQAADLAVFPSLYEGYGLPVVEALACGAPVIASDNSSLRELVGDDGRFDPLDTEAIASAMARALTDSAARERLLAETTRPPPTWGDVADRAAEVYQRLLTRDARARGGGRFFGIVPGWRRRPLVALVSPWPPARTDAAIWAERLAVSLEKHVDVDRYTDAVQPDLATTPSDARAGVAALGSPVVGRVRFLKKTEPWRGGYDAVIACLDDTAFHTEALGLLLRGRRAAVIAHSVRLSELYHRADLLGDLPEGFTAVLHRMYPGLPPELGADGTVPPTVAEQSGILMSRDIIGQSDRFLVAFEYAADIARCEARAEDLERIGILPFACPPPSALPRTEDEGLVCAFGPIGRATGADKLVRAMAELARRRMYARLAFVGTVDTAERRYLEALAGDLGVADRVDVIGWLDGERRQDWLSRCTVGIMLQAHPGVASMLEIGDLFAWGIPTAVRDGGRLRELDECVVRVPPYFDPESLAEILGDLLHDHERRLKMGAAARAFAEAHSFDRAAKELLAVAFHSNAEHSLTR